MKFKKINGLSDAIAKVGVKVNEDGYTHAQLFFDADTSSCVVKNIRIPENIIATLPGKDLFFKLWDRGFVGDVRDGKKISIGFGDTMTVYSVVLKPVMIQVVRPDDAEVITFKEAIMRRGFEGNDKVFIYDSSSEYRVMRMREALDVFGDKKFFSEVYFGADTLSNEHDDQVTTAFIIE